MPISRVRRGHAVGDHAVEADRTSAAAPGRRTHRRGSAIRRSRSSVRVDEMRERSAPGPGRVAVERADLRSNGGDRASSGSDLASARAGSARRRANRDCSSGRYTVFGNRLPKIRGISCRRRCRRSPCRDAPPTSMRLPIGSCPAKYRRAIVSLMIATSGAPPPSAGEKSRPASRRMPIVSKKRGPTSRRLTSTESFAPSTDRPSTNVPPRSGASAIAADCTPGSPAARSRSAA